MGRVSKETQKDLEDALAAVGKSVSKQARKEKWIVVSIFAVIFIAGAAYYFMNPHTVERVKVQTVYEQKPAFWNTLSKEDQKKYMAEGMVYFPEIFSNQFTTKYQRFNQWILERGVTVPNTNDVFSAGGRDIVVVGGTEYRAPRVFVHLDHLLDDIAAVIRNADQDTLTKYWGTAPASYEDRVAYWEKSVAENSAPFLDDTGFPIEEMLNEKLLKH